MPATYMHNVRTVAIAAVQALLSAPDCMRPDRLTLEASDWDCGCTLETEYGDDDTGAHIIIRARPNSTAIDFIGGDGEIIETITETDDYTSVHSKLYDLLVADE